MAADFGPRRR